MSTHLSNDNLASEHLADHHLADDELHAWQAGERSAESAQHVAECAECHRSVRRMEEVLALFGETARAWSAERSAIRRMPAVSVPGVLGSGMPGLGWKRNLPLQRGWAWTAAVTIFLLIVSGGAWVQQVQHQQAARAQQLARDSMLLQQVDEDISQAVPEALAPLGQVAVSSDSTNTSPQ
jgi:hypothetical protein